MKEMSKQYSFNDVVQFADKIKNAGEFIPSSFKGNAGAIAAAIMTGQELGLNPMVSLRCLYVVKGKVGISYDAIIGLLRRSGYGVEWLDEECGSEKATIRLTHPDKNSKPFVLSYTKEDAQKAGLWNNGIGWQKHPAAMLRARCVSNAARAFAGDVLAGIYTEDEIKEIRNNNKGCKKNYDVYHEEIDNKSIGFDNEPTNESTVEEICDFWTLSDEIQDCSNVEQLKIVGEKIANEFALSSDEREKLRDLYKNKMGDFNNEIKQPIS